MATKLEALLSRPTIDDLVAGVLAKAGEDQIRCGSAAMHSFSMILAARRRFRTASLGFSRESPSLKATGARSQSRSKLH